MALWFYHAVQLIDPMDNTQQVLVVGVDQSAGNHGLTENTIKNYLNNHRVDLYFANMAWPYNPPWYDQGNGNNDMRYIYTSTYAISETGPLNWIFRTTTLMGYRFVYLYHIDMPKKHYKKEEKSALRARALKELGIKPDNPISTNFSLGKFSKVN